MPDSTEKSNPEHKKPHSPGRGPSKYGKGGPRKFGKRPQRILDNIDFKEPGLLSNFITDQGKILPGRTTRLHPKDQRKLTIALKRARYMALLPFSRKR